MPSKRIYIGLGIAMICITITYCFFETDLLARICMGAGCILFSIGCYQKFTSVQQTADFGDDHPGISAITTHLS